MQKNGHVTNQINEQAASVSDLISKTTTTAATLLTKSLKKRTTHKKQQAGSTGTSTADSDSTSSVDKEQNPPRRKYTKSLTNKTSTTKSIRDYSMNLSCSLLSHSSPMSNRKISDYFQIRKSSRKCKSEVEKEKLAQIEKLLKNQSEDGLEVRNVPNKGRGIFATRSFARGEFVCEYAGEMITYQLAKKREELYAEDTNVGCYMYYFEYKSKQFCIDATAESDRLGRLLNHSKLEANCFTKLFEFNSKPYLVLMAARDIELGEELLYDYGERNKTAIDSHPWLAT
jgi:[histone H4]-lysine20 N-methyltransferase SETD8